MDSGNDGTFEAFEPGVIDVVVTGKPLFTADVVSDVDDSQGADDFIADLSLDAADAPPFERIRNGISLTAPCPVVVPSPMSCTRVGPSDRPVWSDSASPFPDELDMFLFEWWVGMGETEMSIINFGQHVEGEGPANVDLERSSADYDPVGATVLWNTSGIDMSEDGKMSHCSEGDIPLRSCFQALRPAQFSRTQCCPNLLQHLRHLLHLPCSCANGMVR